jgi:Fur family transcriptional regulator, ferric uptake regulator
MPPAVAERLRAAGLRRSGARDAVIAAFFEHPGHMTIEELTARARRQAPSVGYATVWRAVQLLVENGLAAARDFGRQTRFEAVHARPHHDHLVCTRCGAVDEFEHDEIERLQEEIAREIGFVIDAHKLELYGVCARCRPESRGGAGGAAKRRR